jgi:hypothetical protein
MLRLSLAFAFIMMGGGNFQSAGWTQAITHAKPLIFGIPHPPRSSPCILRLLPYTNDIPKQNKIIACLKHVPKVTTLSTIPPNLIPRRKCIIEKIRFQKITCLPQLEFNFFLK